MSTQNASNCLEDVEQIKTSIINVVKDSHYALGKFLQKQTKIVDKNESVKDMGLQLITVYVNYIKNMKYLYKLLLENTKPLLSSQEFDNYRNIYEEDFETELNETQINCDDEIKQDVSQTPNNDALKIFCEKTGLFINSIDEQNGCAECDVDSEKSFIIDLNDENNGNFEGSASHSVENNDFKESASKHGDKEEENMVNVGSDDEIKSEYLNDTFILDIKEEFQGELLEAENFQNQNKGFEENIPDNSSPKGEQNSADGNENENVQNKSDENLPPSENDKNSLEDDEKRCLNFLYKKDSCLSSSSDESTLGDISDDSDIELNILKKQKSLKLKRTILSDSDVSDVSIKTTKKKAKIMTDSDTDTDTDSSDHTRVLSPKISTPDYPNSNISDEPEDLLKIFENSDGSDAESDSENKSEKKTKTKTPEEAQNINSNNKSEKANTDDKENCKSDTKSDWRNNPLLRQNLSPKSCAKLHQKKQTDEACELKENDPKPGTSRTARDSPLSATENDLLMEVSSSDDSDIEFVNIQRKEAIYIKNSDSEEEKEKIKKTGRRNIRAVLADHDLEVASQKASIEEAERIKRLTNKNRSATSINNNELVLDFDPETDFKIVVNRNLADKLKSHQIEGVKFMWNNSYESIKLLRTSPGTGCILAHTMGLGKTLQAITLIHTLFKYKITNTKHVLIVCPFSTVLNWVNEFNIALTLAEDKNLNLYYDGCIRNLPKQALIKKWFADNRGVLIVGYEAFEKLTKDEQDVEMRNALLDGPDLVICDEGHMLKNMKALRTRALMRIKTKRRIVLTGTPLQNNLREYYYMVQFVKPNLLGSYKEYSNRFVNPITNGQYDDSTAEDIFLMKQRSHVLHKLLKNTVQRYEVSELENYLPNKLDYVLFIQLTSVQRDLYKYYFETFCMNEGMKRKLFNHQYILQMICFHPYLLEMKMRDCNRQLLKNSKKIQAEFREKWWEKFISGEQLNKIDYGPKLAVIFSIIEECEKIGDKVLIFSTNILELNIVEDYLKKIGTPCCRQWRKNFDYFRMDGTLTAARRNDVCNLFNNKNNKQARVFLVSLKVGSLGLNLVAANRVILMDVSWNPACDSQSIFRTYRFGQIKECIVYRLVAMGTMEEVIYERSITKLAVASRVVDEKQISRHFKSQDIQDMFRCRIHLEEERPTLKVPEDKILANIILKHTAIFRYHEHQALLESRPEEQLNTQDLELAWDEFNKEKLKQLSAPQVQQSQTTHLVTKNVRNFSQQKGPNIKLLNNTINLNGSVIRVSDPKVNLVRIQKLPPIINGQNVRWSIPLQLSANINKPSTSSAPNSVINLIDDETAQNPKDTYTEEDPLLVATKWVPLEEDGHFINQ